MLYSVKERENTNFYTRNWNSCKTEGIRSVISIPNRNSRVQTSLIVMFNSVNKMEIVPFSKSILTKEIITRLLCCLNLTDSNGYGSKLLFYNLSLFLWISSLTVDSCNSFLFL